MKTLIQLLPFDNIFCISVDLTNAEYTCGSLGWMCSKNSPNSKLEPLYDTKKFELIGSVTSESIDFDITPYIGKKDKVTGLYEFVDSKCIKDMWVSPEGKLRGLVRTDFVQADSAFHSLLFANELFARNPIMIKPTLENYKIWYQDRPINIIESIYKKDLAYWNSCELMLSEKILVLKSK